MTRDEMESELRDAVSECMLSKWQLCAAGVAVGVPVSIRMKSFLPFLAGGAPPIAFKGATSALARLASTV